MKLSVSLPDADVQFIDEYGQRVGESSRSAVLQRALTALRSQDLQRAYKEAFEEWDTLDQELWDVTAGEGIGQP